MIEVRALAIGAHGTRADRFDGGSHLAICRAQFAHGSRNGSRRQHARPHDRGGADARHYLLHYMLKVNMMCAFGVPGNINHGLSADGIVDRPVLASVAKGMYTTNSDLGLVSAPVATL